MKKCFLVVLLLLCTIFSANSAFALSDSQYTAADILLLEDADIKLVGLQKSTPENNSTRAAKIDDTKQLDSFVKQLLNAKVEIIDRPTLEQDVFLHMGFTTGSHSYRYEHGEGFYIKDLNSDKTVILRYSLPDEYVKNITEDESLRWSGLGAPAAAAPGPPPLCKFTIGSNEFLLNNERKTIDENPLVTPYMDQESSRTMIPLRCLSETLDYKVKWLPEASQVILEKGGFEITLEIGSAKAIAKQYSVVTGGIYLDNESTMQRKEYWQKEFQLDALPTIVNDRTFIPLRFVSDLFDYNIRWYQTENEVYINPKASDADLYTHPVLEISDGEIKAGLKTYNLALITKVMTFSDGGQLHLEVYDNKRNKVISPNGMVTQALTERVIYPGEENLLLREFSTDGIGAGTYYLDACFGNSINNVYRIFFDIE